MRKLKQSKTERFEPAVQWASRQKDLQTCKNMQKHAKTCTHYFSLDLYIAKGQYLVWDSLVWSLLVQPDLLSMMWTKPQV